MVATSGCRISKHYLLLYLVSGFLLETSTTSRVPDFLSRSKWHPALITYKVICTAVRHVSLPRYGGSEIAATVLIIRVGPALSRDYHPLVYRLYVAVYD